MKTTFSLTAVALLALGLLLAGPAPAQGAEPVFTKHFNKSLFDVTRKAAYSIEVLLDDSEYDIGKGVVGLVIHNAKDEDVEDASIAIDYLNLDTYEPADKTPVVKEKGDGLYIVSDLDLNKKGHWKLLITVKSEGVEDSVEFLFPEVLEKIWPAGRYNP
jgi:hypothetical protein